jgi:hypothetical protein
MKPLSIALPLLITTAGCAHRLVSSSFPTSRPNDEALDLISRGLEDAGYRVSSVDRSAGTIATYWRDTGEASRDPLLGGLPANVFVRYSVKSSTGVSQTHTVRIWSEWQRCVAGANVVASSEVVGVCEPIPGPSSERQAVTDALAEHLSHALATSSPLVQASVGAEGGR